MLTLFDESNNGDEVDAYRGTIAHRVLELFDFNSKDDIYTQTEKMVKDGLIKKADIKQINLERIDKAISSQHISSVKSMDLYREKNFLALFPANQLFDVKTDEKVLVQGVIDLLAIDGKNAIVIDYKYSKLSKESLVNKYKKQLDLYAKAVESVCDIKVNKKVLINIFTGESVEIL